jgi:hypothetical protein
MRAAALVLLTLVALALPDRAYATSRNMVVTLDGTNIVMTDKTKLKPVRKVRKVFELNKPVVDCQLDEARTKCWELRKAKKTEPYGVNLRFVNPIPVLPHVGGDEQETEVKPKTSSTISKLPEFEFPSWPVGKKVFGTSPEVFSNKDQSLYFEHSEHIYAPVDKTLGGIPTLEFWRGLVGKRPTRECFEAGDFCSIVLPAKRDGQEALAYCPIANTSTGLGLPYSCIFVAFVESGRWFIRALDGPKDWDGGGPVGLECTFHSSKSLAEISQFLLNVLKSEKTNIELSEHKRTDNSVSYSGKKIAADSQFFKGYFEKASAHFTISGPGSSSWDGFSISGVFVLVVSASRSVVDTDYREIGEINWFQDQVMKIIQDKVAKKVGYSVGCENSGL